MTPSRHKTPNIIGIDPPSPSNFLPPSPQSNHILDRTTTNIVQPNTNHIRQTNPILQQYNNHQLLLVSSPSSTNMSTNNIPAPALTLTPEIMMQIAQLLATHKIPIPGAIQPPPPEELPAASCNNLIEKPPDSQAIQSRLDELPAASRNDLIEKLPDPCDNHLMQSSDPLDNLIESLKPLGSDLSELVSAKNHSSDRTPGSQEDDRDPINTTSTDVAPPNDLLVSRKSAGTQEVELITNVKDFDCIFGEPMDPPPSKKFLSVDSLFEFVQLENLVKRDSSTRKCGCLFQVKGSRSTSKGSTDPYWYLVTMHAQHNHPPSHCPSAHPSHRQLAPDEVLEVRRLSKSNVKTSQILLQLQQADSETLAVNQTINNTIHKIRQEELAGKTPIEALLNLLKQSNWLWDVDINSAGVIQNLFFAHPARPPCPNISSCGASDATYKTNRLSGREQLTQACLESRSYSTGIHPTVKPPCEMHWPSSWTTGIGQQPRRTSKSLKPTSPSSSNLFLSDQQYSSIWRNILPEKEHFVVAWASLFPHLRNLNTSRVESGHAFIKRFILNSTGDLLSVWKALSNAVDHQITHVHASIGQDSIKMLTNIPRSFINLCQKISQHAILEAQKQYERLTDLDPSDTCSKTVFIGSGIPCCHMIADILEYRGLLEPSDFHAQWHLDYNPECLIKEAPVVDLNEEMSKVHLLLSDENSSQLPRIFEQFNQILAGTHLAARIQPPNVKEQTKERPTHKKGATNSTKRLPSAHELAEAALAKEQKIVKAALAKKKRSIKPKPTKARKRVKKSVDRLSDVGAGESSDDEASDFGDLSALEDIDLYSKDVPDGADVKEGVRDHISENRPNGANVKDGVDVKEGARDNISGNQPCIYHSQVPVVFKKFVHNIFNPLGDGNCGFRCLAKALEYPDNGWFRVRQEMGKEVEANLAFYSKLQGGEASIKKIIAGLKVAKITAKIPLSKWLNKLDHGQVIANTYQRPIVFISTESSGTFIPSQLGPRDENAVNDVKPIPPIMGSKKLASQRSHDRGWKADLKAELNLYNQELKNKKNE
ncbi:hypothetical protein PSHT_16246 [Puccinia striiformis]|uniref:OTU domain-containing protein n=1 Tax=Puccinia striiformis TaxID=27350 RepID=A0A2S4UAU8_9BASI|nr:hypothetical protein PSHT_16246 [Puccinia striiformis]